MKVKAKKVPTMNSEYWQKLDDRQAETISGSGEGQAGTIDYKELKPADLKYERCDPGTCCWIGCQYSEQKAMQSSVAVVENTSYVGIGAISLNMISPWSENEKLVDEINRISQFSSITSRKGAKAMLRPLVENLLQPHLSSAPLQEFVVTLDEQNEVFHEELNEHQEESLSGGRDLEPASFTLIRPGGNAYVIERRERRQV